MADEIIGVEPAPNPLADLRAKCEVNGCAPVLRVETVNGQVRFSLAANPTDPSAPLGKPRYDLRDTSTFDAARDTLDSLIAAANAEWWA